MQRKFNTMGICRPDKHYMVHLDERVKQIKEQYVDNGYYFAINRGRQFGKTTTIRALAEYLEADYLVFSLDFQKLSTADFESEWSFTAAFIRLLSRFIRDREELRAVLDSLKTANQDKIGMGMLFEALSELCRISAKPIVMIVDEVDSASNNQVFIDFLAQLRGYYLEREDVPTFHSVVLAGVYNIKNLKLKIRPDEEHQYNSPWNIAADFLVRMDFSAKQIASMLREYEADRHTGMDVEGLAEYIYAYTSGYPYLVSAICKQLDERLPYEEKFQGTDLLWTKEGVNEAVKNILSEPAPLFESLTRQLAEYPSMKQMLKETLFQGKRISFNVYTKEISLAAMFGYINNDGGSIQVANRIFETQLYNLFLSEEELSSEIYNKAQGSIGQFVKGNRLDMELVVAKFVEYYHDIYGGSKEQFLEENGRRLFLLFLRPIINGTGNYYIEAQTRDARRTDVIVDYLGEQFIIELKIWHGNEYNARGEEQLAEYLDYYHKELGYLISFNFNKNKEIGVREIMAGGKRIVEAVV